jgi:hypothetical protein
MTLHVASRCSTIQALWRTRVTVVTDGFWFDAGGLLHLSALEDDALEVVGGPDLGS